MMNDRVVGESFGNGSQDVGPVGVEFSNRSRIVGDGVNFGPSGKAFHCRLVWTPIVSGSVLFMELDPDGGLVQSLVDGVGVQSLVDDGVGNIGGGSINYETGVISGLRFENTPALGNAILANYAYRSGR